MNFSAKPFDADKQRSECLILGVYEGAKLTSSAAKIDKLCKGLIGRVLKQGDINGQFGQILLLPVIDTIPAQRLLLVGCGKDKPLSATQYRNLQQTVTQKLCEYKIKDAVNYLAEVDVTERELEWKIRQGCEVVAHSLYQFNQLKSDKKPPAPGLRKMQWHVSHAKSAAGAGKAGKIGHAVANGMALARDLGNLPGNICTPSYLASQAKKLAREYGMKTRVLNEKQMQELGMGSLLSVARGTREPARLIIIEYQGGKKPGNPVALVGKGVTFDSGGISIKPGPAMDEMKFDMCGAASVLGTMRAIGELKLKMNVVAIIPSTENLPDGNASKPGDIVTSMSGQTIEILNTDAEGRLILCDALTYAERYKPKAVIDIATLTGACVIALGKHVSGLLGNNQPLLDKLRAAGDESMDRTWQLPLHDEYQSQLDSNFADMANIGGRDAGTITAACFLSRFTKNLKWAHLDIAGVAWDSGSNKGATGRPVPLLTQYLINEAGK